MGAAMTIRRLTAALVLALVASPPARAGDATGAFAPYEDILQVIADLTWHLNDDVYRFASPKDATGHELYQLALRRIENWEKRYPGRLTDVTGFTRAEALERLGEYKAAADVYRQVAGMQSPLADKARAGADRAAAFAVPAGLPESGGDLDASLTALRKKLDAWGAVVQQFDGTPYQATAMAEEERLETIVARLIVENRRGIDEGPKTAERSLRFLVAKHTDSKNLPEHIMRLGDLYAELARDYVEEHQRPLAFDEDEFDARADRALDMYRKVATWDGAPEKPEAQGRFAAFDAYKTAVVGRYR
jgi:tetratricopeptide (TPR) repeat protein